MKISRSRWGALIVAALIYMLFVSGGVVPYSIEDPQKAMVKAVLLIISIVALKRPIYRGAAVVVSVFVLVGLLIGLLALAGARNIDFSVEKIDGAILCSAFIVLLIDCYRVKYGSGVLQIALLQFSAVVLVLTVGYKIQFGFFDRSVRFFLNGPIVYGWLMGGVAILSFHAWKREKKAWLLGLFFAFVGGLFWTESKGSILAFFAAFGIYFLSSSKRKMLHGFSAVAAIFLLYLFLYDPVLELLGDSRLAAGARFLSGQLGDVDEGSFGVREALQRQAISDFLSNPWLGIGIGEFHYGDFVYPHNQHLELFAEMGFLVGLLHVFFVVTSFFKASDLLRSMIVLFAVGGSFSGDASYLRFLYASCLLAWIVSSHARQRVVAKNYKEFRKN